MIHKHISILFFILLFIPTLVLAQGSLIYEENTKSVVIINAYNQKDELMNQGSGFIVKPDGVIVTNFHVIKGAHSATVKLWYGEVKVEGILFKDREKDFAVIKIKGKEMPTVKLGNSDGLTPGERVYAIGSPVGLENTISEGVVSGLRKSDDGKKIIQTTTSISEGSSGGALFNTKGEVVGITTFKITDAQHINFAIPINVVKNKLDGNKLHSFQELLTEGYDVTDYNKAVYHFRKGVRLSDRKEFDKATDEYKKALKYFPHIAEAHNNLGFAYLDKGDFDKAISEQEKALEINPRLVNAYYGLALAYEKKGELDEAIKNWEKYLKYAPTDSIWWLRVSDRLKILKRRRLGR